MEVIMPHNYRLENWLWCVSLCGVHTWFICVGVHAYVYSCICRLKERVGCCPQFFQFILFHKVSYWTPSSLNWLAHPEDLPICLSGTGVLGTLLCTAFYVSAWNRTKSLWLCPVTFTSEAIFPVPRYSYIDLQANFEVTLSFFILPSPSISPAQFLLWSFRYQSTVELGKEK